MKQRYLEDPAADRKFRFGAIWVIRAFIESCAAESD
jgi:hypothetical protein